MKKIGVLLLSFLLFNNNIFSRDNSIVVSNCAPPTATTSIDINNVRAQLMNGGDMWWSSSNTKKGYEVPKESNKENIVGGALWFSGADISGNLYTAGQTYRQTGYDFWPGPLSNTGTTDSIACKFWDKMFSVYGTEIVAAKNGTSYSQSVLNWPGSIAPFYDVNFDGIYNPQEGDYPTLDPSNASNIPGQMVWWVFNDVGNIHTAFPGSMPIGIEVQATSFAYPSTNTAIVNNTTMYRYKLINKSINTIYDFKVGQFVNGDIDGADDDYVGCDLSIGSFGKKRDLFFTYNSDPDIGLIPAAIGITILKTMKNAQQEDINASSFMFFSSQGILGINTVPRDPTELRRYMNSLWADAAPLTYGTPTGRGAGEPTSFAFPGSTDPLGRPTWVETDVPGDRAMLTTIGGNYNFLPGATQEIISAVVWAKAHTGNNITSLELLKLSTDTLKEKYSNDFEEYWTGIKKEKIEAKVFPNPTMGEVNIQLENPYMELFVDVYSINGRKLFTEKVKNTSQVKLQITHYPKGVYLMKIHTGKNEQIIKVIKN